MSGQESRLLGRWGEALAAEELRRRGCAILVPHETVVKGDSLSASIAAASILAKVSRDRFMVEQDRLYPAYGFARHKGYGTAQHREAIARLGPCPIHRRTFLKG